MDSNTLDTPARVSLNIFNLKKACRHEIEDTLLRNTCFKKYSTDSKKTFMSCVKNLIKDLEKAP